MKKHLFLILAICSSQIMSFSVSAQGFAYGWSTATDARGNVFVTGQFDCTSIVFGTTTLTNTGGTDMYIVKYDKQGNVKWAKSAVGSLDDVGRSITTDGSGNAYVTGYFKSPIIRFGTITLTNAASGTMDMYIVKYDSSGNVLWAQRAGGSLMDSGQELVTDGSGNVYVVGRFTSSSITFGTLPGNTITLTNPAPGSWVMFMVKYDPNGNVLWASGFDNSVMSGSYGNGLITDGSGNVYLTGNFGPSPVTFGTTTLTSAGGMDVFIVKYDAAGNVLWATSAGGSLDDLGVGIATDGGGNVYVTGNFYSSFITFGETTLINPSSGNEAIFTVKYSNSGTVLWAKGATGNTHSYYKSIAADFSGNVYVTGEFLNPTLTFGTITLKNAGSYDMYIVKYDANGNVTWAKSAGGTGWDYSLSNATDGNGNVYLTGMFSSPSIKFGTITLNNTYGTKLPLPFDMFLAKYDANGNVPWAKCAGAKPIGKPKSANAGINDPPANEITVYPNPTSGKVTLSTGNSQASISSISVFNMTGKEVFSRQSAVGSQQIELDLSSQPKGLYILLIKAGDNYYRKKIILE
jgi:hypothetical protein